MVSKKMSIVIDWDGREVDYDSAVALMDDDIRRGLHAVFSPCSEQDFFDAYLIAHYVKYGEVFTV